MGDKEAQRTISEQIVSAPVVMYSTTSCGYCVKAKKLLSEQGLPFASFELNQAPLNTDKQLRQRLAQTLGNTVPQIFICGTHIGGYAELSQLSNLNKLHSLVSKCKPNKHTL